MNAMCLTFQLGCCGVSNNNEGFRDWNANKYFNCTDSATPIGEECSVPYSCCIKQSVGHSHVKHIGEHVTCKCRSRVGSKQLVSPSSLKRIWENVSAVFLLY